MERMKWKDFNGARRRHYQELGFDAFGDPDVRAEISAEWRAYKQGASIAELDAVAARDTHTQEVRMSAHEDETQVIGGRRVVETLRLAIPMVADGGEISDDAAWDIAEGVLDYLVGQSNTPDKARAMRERASAIKRRVRGEDSGGRGDQLEYQLGRKVGEMLMLVALDRGLSAEQWLGLMVDLLDPASALGIQPVGSPTAIEPPRGSILDRLRGSAGARQLTDSAGRAGARALGGAARASAGQRFGPALGDAAGAAVEGAANSVIDLITGGADAPTTPGQ